MSQEETLLVVDNNLTSLKLLSVIAESAKYKVITATNGKQALQILEENHSQIDAISLEWMLPEIDGLEVLKLIKKNPKLKDLPVLMVTTQAREYDIKEGINAGAYYYMKKPFKKEQLVSVLRAAITDYRGLKDLTARLAAGKNISHTMIEIEGTFKFKTINESYELSHWFAGVCPNSERAISGLTELMKNSIEHGNLGITYDEKSEFLGNSTMEEEIIKRLRFPENLGKYAEATLKRNSGEVRIYVKDQGEGFNYKKYLELDEERVFDSHGRGIAMSKMLYFDDLTYFGKGNEVEVVFNLTK